MPARSPAPPPLVIDFSLADDLDVVAEMRRILDDRSGWVNASPVIPAEEIVGMPGSGTPLARLFSARGPTVPLVSWVPGPLGRDGTAGPVELGLQHAGGPKAVAQLRDAGHGPPSSWQVLSDNPRRGIVLVVPAEEDPRTCLEWSVRAAALLSPLVLPSAWRAAVFTRR
jgi:hypothetical protein